MDHQDHPVQVALLVHQVYQEHQVYQATQVILDRPAGLQLLAIRAFQATLAFLLIQAFQATQVAGCQGIVV